MPPRGGNQLAFCNKWDYFVFQLMPPRGGNQSSGRGENRRGSFNSCPREGAIPKIRKQN